MKKEHYIYISEKFNLNQYFHPNSVWLYWYELINVSDLIIIPTRDEPYLSIGVASAKDVDNSGIWFDIPSLGIARNIIATTQRTELLFI